MRSTITRAGDGIAINFAPVVAPHRKAGGRLAIRVERLPQQARFSRGNRNSNGSWSLASDELDDLSYFVAEGTGDHTLAIRIINLNGGNTLAVLDFPVSPAAAAEDDDEVAEPIADDSDDSNELIDTLRAQLAQMKTALTAREAELATARKAAAREAAARQAATPARDIDAELEELRTEMQAEFDERLTAVGAQSAADLKKQRDTWSSDMNARLATLTAKAQQQLNEAGEIAEREKQEALDQAKAEWQREETERLTKAKADWLAQAAKAAATVVDAHSKTRDGEVEALRNQLQRDAEGALENAKAVWKAEEASRLAAAEARWRVESEKAIAQARAETAASHDGNHADALEALRASLEADAQTALAKAKENWKNEEVTRLAAAQAEWQRTTDRALADARAAASAGEQTTDSANKALRDEVANLRSMLAERDTALTETVKAAERSRRDAETALTSAEARWKAEEAARLATEHAKWRAEADAALAKARADMSKAQGAGNEAMREELRQQLATVSAKLAERDTAITEARNESDKLRRELKEALAKPAAPVVENTDVDDLQKKIASLEANLAEGDAALAEARDIIEQQRQAAKAKPQRAKKESDAGEEQRWAAISNELAEARSRYEAAELALAQVRMRAKDEGRIHQDLTSTRAALAAREKELADLRAKFTPLDGQELEGSPAAATHMSTEQSAKPQFSKTFIAGVTAAAFLLAVAIVFYPMIEARLYPPPPPPAAAPEVKETARLEPAVVEQKAVLLRDAKLRAEASNSAKIVATVTKGFEVVVVESQGKWTLVRMGADAKAQQGWVLQSALNTVEPTEPEARLRSE